MTKAADFVLVTQCSTNFTGNYVYTKMLLSYNTDCSGVLALLELKINSAVCWALKQMVNMLRRMKNSIKVGRKKYVFYTRHIIPQRIKLI